MRRSFCENDSARSHKTLDDRDSSRCLDRLIRIIICIKDTALVSELAHNGFHILNQVKVYSDIANSSATRVTQPSRDVELSMVGQEASASIIMSTVITIDIAKFLSHETNCG